MITKIIEVTNEKFNWGKFLICRLTDEWRVMSTISDLDIPLLPTIGWDRRSLLIFDLQTKEGACFMPSRNASPRADLGKHAIWVCPMFEPFLVWLYDQDLTDIIKLPSKVEFTNKQAPPDTHGYRRKGPEGTSFLQDMAEARKELADKGITVDASTGEITAGKVGTKVSPVVSKTTKG